jgi:hypothetical protein
MFVLFALLMVTGLAMAQSAASTGDNSIYFVTYFSNNVAAAPDATVRFVNDGDTNGNLWAAFYVFDDSEELQECCACEVTPDGLLAEDVKTQLTANAITGKVPTRGVIKVISSGTSDPTNVSPTAGLRGWATHIQVASKTAFAITEDKFADANLGAPEEAMLQNLCFYDAMLSGLPCTCTVEDHEF